MLSPINKTMNRDDLLVPEAGAIVDELNGLIRTLYARGLYTTSWYGSLPDNVPIRTKMARWLWRRDRWPGVGIDNRGSAYRPLPGAADDARLPWYLYWEIAWLLLHGPVLAPAAHLLDAGGTSSLFTCYLASRGHEVHSIDLKPHLSDNADSIGQAMGWRMHSYAMDMAALGFPDEFFDHAYSVCVFEHLDHATKQAALRQIARCLKPGGRLCVTFDYRNPAPFVTGVGADPRPQNRLSTPDDLRQSFLSSGAFRLLGNEEFYDDGTSWLVRPDRDNAPYTFGALFLQKV